MWLTSPAYNHGAPVRRRTKAHLAVVIGAVVLALSPFLPWARVIFFGSLNLFDLTSFGDNNATWFPVLILIAGIGLAVLGLTRRRGAYVVALIVGLIGGALGVLLVIDLVHEVDKAEGLATLGIGPFVGVFALAIIVIGSIVGLVADRS